MSYHLLVASLTLMALFSKKRATRVRLATSICYGTLMKKCFNDWSQSKSQPLTGSAQNIDPPYYKNKFPEKKKNTRMYINNLIEKELQADTYMTYMAPRGTLT